MDVVMNVILKKWLKPFLHHLLPDLKQRYKSSINLNGNGLNLSDHVFFVVSLVVFSYIPIFFFTFLFLKPPRDLFYKKLLL